MKNSRRILAIVLAICMTLTLQPMTALGLTTEVADNAISDNVPAPAANEADTNNEQIDNADNDENIDTQADEPVAVVGADSFTSFKEAWEAVLNGNGKTLTLLADATLAINADVSISTTDTIIDLNGYTLDITGVGENGINITNGGNVTIQNGNVTANDVTNVINPVFQIEKDSSLKLDGVNFTTDGTGLYPRGDAAKLEVINSEINANAYAVATNAATAENYNVVIELTESKLTAENTAVLVNVPCTLNADKCKFFAKMQGVIVRGGTANIENSTITQAYDGNKQQAQSMADYFLNRDWGSGNMVNLAALTIGNKGNSAYQYPTDVTLVNTELKVEGEYADLFPALYAWANEAEENGVTLTMEKCTVDESKIVLGNEGNNITVNKDKYAAYIKGGEHYATLQAALNAANSMDNAEIVLLKDIDAYEDNAKSHYLVMYGGSLDLNGHTITGRAGLTLAAIRDSSVINGKVVNKNTASSAAAVAAQNATINMEDVTVEASSIGVALGLYGTYPDGTKTRRWGSANINNCNIAGGKKYISGGSIGIAIFGAESDFAQQSSLLLTGNTTVSGAGYGISGNGSCDNTYINISGNTEVTGGMVGLYHPQQGTMYFGDNAKISGPVGLQICGGNLYINGGTLESTETKEIASPFKPDEQGDGTAQDGAALSILSRQAYGSVTVDISNGGAGDNLTIPKFITANPQNPVISRYGLEKIDGKWVASESEFGAPNSLLVEGGEYDNDIQKYVSEPYASVLYDNVGQYGKVFRVERPSVENSVAMIEKGGITTYYKTLQEAIDAAQYDETAQAGDEVVLLKSAEEDIIVAEDKNLTLNLGVYSLTNKAGHTITNNGTLQIVGEGTVDNITHQKAAIVNNGTITLAGGKYTRSAENSILGNAAGANSYYVVYNDGVMNIEDGAIMEGTSEKSSMLINGAKKNATLNINGGELSQEKFCTVKNDDYGTLNITGGKIGGVNPVQNWAEAVIRGGEIDGIVYTAVWSDKFNSETIIENGADIKGAIKALGYADKDGNLPASKAAVKVNGGNFDVDFDVTDDNADVTVSGGTFTKTVADEYLANGFHCTGADTEFIVNQHSLAKVEAKVETCTEDGNVEYWHCADCNKNYSDEAATTVLDTTLIEKTWHKTTLHDAQKATCEADGNVRYFHCENCGKNFEDSTCQHPLESVVDKKIAHNTVYHEAVAATCTTAGNHEYWTCDMCNKVYNDINMTANDVIDLEDTVIPAISHNVEHHDAVAATCTTDGTIEYWSCDRCNKNFSDAECTTEVASIVAEATGHNVTHHDAVAATCTTDGTIEYWSCDRCDKNFSDAECTTEVADIVAEATGHNVTHHDAVAATCTTDGTIQYWSCDRCDKNFSDAECTTEVADIVTEATGHDVTRHDAVAPTCTTAGNVAYYECAACGTIFGVDENGEADYNHAITDVTVAATDHNIVVQHNETTHWTVCLNAGCDYRTEAVAHELVQGTPSGNQRVDTCGFEGCGWTRTVTLGGGGGGGGSTVTPTPTGGETEIDDPDVPLAKPFLFTDVTEKDWCYDAVKYVNDEELMNGLSDTLFGPNDSTTRGMIATIIYRMEGKPAPEKAYGFEDVVAGSWYADAVNWAAGVEVVKGYDEKTYAPDQNITREQLVAILFRYANMKNMDTTAKGDLSKFADSAQITPYAEEALTWAVGAGLMSGREGNMLAPQGQTTRAELAQVLMRFQNAQAENQTQK